MLSAVADTVAAAAQRTRRHLPLAALFVVIAAVVVPLTAFGYERFSPFDEATHVDLALRMARGDVVVRGDTLLPEVVREWACRGFYDPAVDFPSCDTQDLDPAAFPAGGLQYNWFHAPGYYLTTGVLARLAVAATPVDSFVSAARLVGVLWLAAAMGVTHALARLLGSGRSAGVAVAVAFAFVPTVVHLAGIVNNDVASAVAGGVVMLVAVSTAHRVIALPPLTAAGSPGGGARLVALVAVTGVAAGLIKVVVFPAVVAGALVLFLGPIVTARRDLWRRALLLAVVLGFGFAVSQGVWWATQTMRAGDRPWVDPIPSDLYGDEITVGAVLRTAGDTFPPTSRPFVAERATNLAMERWQGVVDTVVMAVPLALVSLFALDLWRRRRVGPEPMSDPDPMGDPDPTSDPDPMGALVGVATVVGLAVGAVGLTVQHWIAKDSIIEHLHARYGLAMLPALLAGLAVVADRHWLARAALWLGVCAGAAVVITAHLR
jgi:hypothetical protein